MSVTKRKNMTERTSATALGTDIASLQDSAGASWFKITLTNLATWVKNQLIAASHTWASLQTFGAGADMDSNKIINVDNGTASSDAVNKGQLDDKQDEITGSNEKLIYKDNSGNVISSDIGFDNTTKAINRRELSQEPTDTSDTYGEDGDEGWYGVHYYKKLAGTGWIRHRFDTF